MAEHFCISEPVGFPSLRGDSTKLPNCIHSTKTPAQAELGRGTLESGGSCERRVQRRLAAGDGAQDDQGLRPCCNRGGQRRVWRFMGQVFLAGKES